jgi:mRNA-degrading endonuclease RelE of RelBE toxin-antitoxin system
MAYAERYSEVLAQKLAKLNKKDPASFERVERKIKEVLEHPEHEYKNLRHDMSDFKRVHIGHFVLTFRVDHKNKIVWFDDYDHHDNIYKR